MGSKKLLLFFCYCGSLPAFHSLPLPHPTLALALPCPQMVDVGCGIGGSSRHIARKFGCEARGITLSPVQAQRANQITAQQGLGDRVSFQVAGG
jgi:SAM-dependent methyltransferase